VGREAQNVPFISGCQWEQSQLSGAFPEEGSAGPHWQWGWQRTREGPAGWRGGSRRDKGSTCFGGGGFAEIRAPKLWGQKHDQISPPPQLSELCLLLLLIMSLGSLLSPVSWQVPGEHCNFRHVLLENSQKTLFWAKKAVTRAVQLPAGSGQRDFSTPYQSLGIRSGQPLVCGQLNH